ncbi:histone H3.v1-like [Engraulis encrasicolus]|uniref:histone H3.v1-like n=1 Tax=Engraulis encrasicolus TaxID=184585 RepID=UPI002FD3C7D3
MEAEQEHHHLRPADHNGSECGADPNAQHTHKADQNLTTDDTEQNHEAVKEEQEEDPEEEVIHLQEEVEVEVEEEDQEEPEPLLGAAEALASFSCISTTSSTNTTTSSFSRLRLPSTTSPTRRSISMGDFKRVGPGSGSETPSAASTAPSSKLVTPSSSMEFEAARRRLLEVEERQRVIHEMERRLEELREVFVRSEQEAVEHGEIVARISTSAQQGELFATENTQRFKKRFKRHRPTIVFSSMLGLRTCLPWPVKLK